MPSQSDFEHFPGALDNVFPRLSPNNATSYFFFRKRYEYIAPWQILSSQCLTVRILMVCQKIIKFLCYQLFLLKQIKCLRRNNYFFSNVSNRILQLVPAVQPVPFGYSPKVFRRLFNLTPFPGGLRGFIGRMSRPPAAVKTVVGKKSGSLADLEMLAPPPATVQGAFR